MLSAFWNTDNRVMKTVKHSSLLASPLLTTNKVNYGMKMTLIIFYDCCPPFLQGMGGKIANYI